MVMSKKEPNVVWRSGYRITDYLEPYLWYYPVTKNDHKLCRFTPRFSNNKMNNIKLVRKRSIEIPKHKLHRFTDNRSKRHKMDKFKLKKLISNNRVKIIDEWNTYIVDAMII